MIINKFNTKFQILRDMLSIIILTTVSQKKPIFADQKSEPNGA